MCSRLVVVIVSDGMSTVANATPIKAQNVVCTKGARKCARVQESVQGCKKCAKECKNERKGARKGANVQITRQRPQDQQKAVKRPQVLPDIGWHLYSSLLVHLLTRLIQKVVEQPFSIVECYADHPKK